jgi:hypothetical protein
MNPPPGNAEPKLGEKMARAKPGLGVPGIRTPTASA